MSTGKSPLSSARLILLLSPALCPHSEEVSVSHSDAAKSLKVSRCPLSACPGATFSWSTGLLSVRGSACLITCVSDTRRQSRPPFLPHVTSPSPRSCEEFHAAFLCHDYFLTSACACVCVLGVFLVIVLLKWPVVHGVAFGYKECGACAMPPARPAPTLQGVRVNGPFVTCDPQLWGIRRLFPSEAFSSA